MNEQAPAGVSALFRGLLVQEWPAFLGYFVSFAFIVGSWIAQSNMTRFTKTADAALIRLNLLLFVSFLPFTTSLMATHLNDPGERLAVVIFGLNLTLCVPCSLGSPALRVTVARADSGHAGQAVRLRVGRRGDFYPGLGHATGLGG